MHDNSLHDNSPVEMESTQHFIDGLGQDIRRRLPHYGDDFKQGVWALSPLLTPMAVLFGLFLHMGLVTLSGSHDTRSEMTKDSIGKYSKNHATD